MSEHESESGAQYKKAVDLSQAHGQLPGQHYLGHDVPYAIGAHYFDELNLHYAIRRDVRRIELLGYSVALEAD